MIKRTDEGDFVISSRGQWLPGIYADEAAANLAFRVNPLRLRELWESKCPQPLTADEVRSALRKQWESRE